MINQDGLISIEIDMCSFVYTYQNKQERLSD